METFSSIRAYEGQRLRKERERELTERRERESTNILSLVHWAL